MPPRSCSRRESTNFHLSYTFLHLWMKKHHTIAESMAQQKEDNILDGFTQCTQMTIRLPTYFPGHKPLGITNQQECHEDAHHGQPSVAQLLHQIDQSWPTSHAGRFKFGLESLWVQTSFRCWSNHTFKTQPGLVSLMVVYIYTHNFRWYIRMYI